MTSRFAVAGSPIDHSRSPALHRAAISSLGIDASYDAVDVTAAQLPNFLSSLDSDWEGLSLTMPLKQAIRPLLVDECHTSVLTGSVNTAVRTPEGWSGYNTDVWGATTAIRQQFGSEFRRAVLLGSGATASSLVVALHNLGVDSLDIMVRVPVRAADVKELARLLGIDARIVTFGERTEPAELVVSSLPSSAVVSAEALDGIDAEFLFDVVYDPWPSAIGQEWVARGLETMNGLPMLLWQAVRQARVLYGDSIDEPLPDEELLVTRMRAAVGL